MPVAVQWVIAIIILLAYSCVVWLAMDMFATYLNKKYVAFVQRKKRQKFIKQIKVILNIYGDTTDRLKCVELSFDAMFDKKKKDERPSCLRLIEVLGSCHVDLLDEKDEERLCQEILALIKHLESEASYRQLPGDDQKVIDPLRSFLKQLDQPDLVSTCVRNVTDLLAAKNAAIEHITMEMGRIITGRRQDYVLGILSIIIGLVSLNWFRQIASKLYDIFMSWF
ncbi:hypothetical protein C4J81_12950 [Deltaproteobacteria bacterium Smac51]|nr:hypothetical protein C4J81_12950 [Deltaproteobacteria bacterium Smac51]